jgi:altronate dehydratase small subunit
MLPKPRCFQIQPQDNVATLMDDAAVGSIEIIGATRGEIVAPEKIERGHKVALRDINANEAVVKFGVRIGHATQSIKRGAWVHLHNLASDLDDRSGTLDLHSGAPTDTASAYV